MAIADLTAYKQFLASPGWIARQTKGSVTGVAGRLTSIWTATADAGVAPTTAAVPTNATTGSLGQVNGGAGRLSLLEARIASASAGLWILCDRLSHQGGLSAIVTTAQTTNLPTAALTRYTSGVGVMAGIEIYTQIGTTGTTVTASYTDQDGTAGQTTQPVAIGATGFRELGRLLPLSLATGDYGVRSVESVTVLATTGTAGNFGITLYKPLAAFPVHVPNIVHEYDALLGASGNCPEILDNACLFWLVAVSSVATSGQTLISLRISEV